MTQVSIVKELAERAGIGRTTAKNTIRDVKAAMGVDTTEYSDATRGQILQAAESGHAMCAVTSESTFEEIRDSGIFNGSKALEHRLLFGQCVAALFDKCETVQGGSDFGQRCAEYWGLSRTAAQNALEIGRREYFSEFGKVLPTAESTLLELAKLPEQTFKEKVESGDIKPTMTAADAKAFTTPKPQPQTAQQPRGDVPPPSDPDAVEVTFEELEDEPEVDSVAEALEEAGVEPLDPKSRIPSIHQMPIVALDHKLEGLNPAQKRAVRQFINHTVSQRVYRKVQEGVKEKQVELDNLIHQYGDRINGSKEDKRRVIACLHPDRPDRSRVKLNNALQAFNRLLGEA